MSNEIDAEDIIRIGATILMREDFKTSRTMFTKEDGVLILKLLILKPRNIVIRAMKRYHHKRTLEDLPLKRRLFIKYYFGEALGNGAKAARMAGYHFPKQEAWRLRHRS